MREIGLAAAPSSDSRASFQRRRLQAIGGFTPLLLHRPDHDPLWDEIDVLERYAATGARTFTHAGYDGWYVLEQDTVLTEEPR